MGDIDYNEPKWTVWLSVFFTIAIPKLVPIIGLG